MPVTNVSVHENVRITVSISRCSFISIFETEIVRNRKKHETTSLSCQVNHLLDNMTTCRLLNFKTKLKYYGTQLKHAIHGGTVIAFRSKLNL
jgi:hypothetical protein